MGSKNTRNQINKWLKCEFLHVFQRKKEKMKGEKKSLGNKDRY